MGKRVLVTGASGFAGSVVVAELLRRGFSVVGLYRTELPSRLESLAGSPGCEFVQADLKEELTLQGPVDAIVHCAGQAQPTGRPVSDYLENNVQAAVNLVEFAVKAKVERIINFSSLSVYGDIRSPVVDEGTDMIDVSPYGISKYLAETVLNEAAAEVPSVSVRLPGILGEGSTGPWLAKVYGKARRNDNIEIFNPDALFNNAVHIRELSEFITLLLEADITGFDVLTLGCADPMSVYETVHCMTEACGSSSEISAKPANSSPFIISNDKAIQKYGYCPRPLRKVLNTFVNENCRND